MLYHLFGVRYTPQWLSYSTQKETSLHKKKANSIFKVMFSTEIFCKRGATNQSKHKHLLDKALKPWPICKTLELSIYHWMFLSFK